MGKKVIRQAQFKFTIFFYLFAVFFTIAAIYFVTSPILYKEGISYRSWISFTAWISALLLVPLSLIANIICTIDKSAGDVPEKNKKLKAIAGISVMVVLGFLYTLAVIAGFVLFGDSAFEKEELIASNVIKGTKDIFLDDNRISFYYKPVFFIMKKKYQLTDYEVVTAIMEKRYEEEFEVVKSEQTEMVGHNFTLAQVNNKNMLFHVNMVWSLDAVYADDYIDVRANNRALEYAGKYCPERVLKINNKYANLVEGLQMICERMEDADACAEDMSGMVAYVLEDPFFAEPGHNTTFTIVYGGNEAKPEEMQTEFGNDTIKEEPSEEWIAPLIDENGFLTPEGAYEKLYQAVFEPKGDEYECTYNAKGNFYAILGRDEEIKNGEKLNTTRTVVYDRVSKNGKCQLFVAYKEYHYDNGIEYTTAILNFYAVDMQTGTVYAGDKKNWGGIPSDIYREATGE